VDLPVDLDAVRATLRAHGVVFALVFGDLDEAPRPEQFRRDFVRAHD
jgi:hypothetical protein